MNKQVDLHGVTHKEVISLLEENLLGYHSTEGWSIITGNSPYMIEIVENFLKEHDYKWFREDHNYGRIILAE